jgi:hypothetical protein
MRPFNLGQPSDPGKEAFEQWVRQAFAEIEAVSNDGIEKLFDEYTIVGAYTESRSLTPATATASQIANFLATLVEDVKSRGSNRA